jgi:translation initiation factor IF-3
MQAAILPKDMLALGCRRARVRLYLSSFAHSAFDRLPHEEPQTCGVPLSRPFRPRSFHPREPLHRRNGKIRAREVRVLDENKQQLGVMSLNEALRLAQGKDLDLVEVVPQAVPPVCRIVNYGRLLYEEAKRESHARPTAGQMKEIQVSPVIDPHDLATKRNQAIQFLCDDMQVRVKLRFRGRQKAHKEIGFQVVNQFVQDVAAYGRVDAPPKMLGDRDLNAIISPLPRNKRAGNPRELSPEDSQSPLGVTPPRPTDPPDNQPGDVPPAA